MSTVSLPLAGRTALITGASRGIGAAVAKRFAAAGAHVILLARTVGGLEEVDDHIQSHGGTATLVPQDLLELNKLDNLGPMLHQRFPKLDIFVGNTAMLGTLGPLSHTDTTMWDRVMTINVTANFRLVRTLDPLLRASDAGRAIFVTSGVAHSPFAYWGAYSASKAALEMMVKIYAAEVSQTSLRVNLINPGSVATAMRAHAFPGEDPASLPTPDSIADQFLELACPACTYHGQILNI